MKKLLLTMVLLSSACLAFGEDLSPVVDRTLALDLVKAFFVNSWPALLAWGLSELMPFLPTKANGIVQLVYLWVKGKQQP